MNKSEFIEYINKIPDDIQFTPMRVDVRGETPLPDGTYKTINKKIKFECNYTTTVHQLPYVKHDEEGMPMCYGGIYEDVQNKLEKVFGENSFHLLDENRLNGPPYGNRFNDPNYYEKVEIIAQFYKICSKFNKSIIRKFKPEYGIDTREWGAVPIYVLANLLRETLARKNTDYFHVLYPEIKDVLYDIINYVQSEL